jgi:hypothetical protein
MHFQDEITNLAFNGRSSRRPRAAFPPPVEAEALSVPADHGLRAHEKESLTLFQPKPRKPGPESVGGLNVDAPSGALALEEEQLVAKREYLALELRETTAKMESQPEEPEGQGTPSKAR